MKTFITLFFLFALQTEASTLTCLEENGDSHSIYGVGTSHITFSDIKVENRTFYTEASLIKSGTDVYKGKFASYESGQFVVRIPTDLSNGTKSQGIVWINFDRDDSDSYDALGSPYKCTLLH